MPRLGDVEAERLEQVVALLRLWHAEHLLVEKIDIHHAGDSPLAVHHREREELVQHEKFTGVEHRGRLGDRDHAPDHHFRELFTGLREEQAARLQHAGELRLRIHHVEINHRPARVTLRADQLQRLLHAHRLAELQETPRRVIAHRPLHFCRISFHVQKLLLRACGGSGGGGGCIIVAVR